MLRVIFSFLIVNFSILGCSNDDISVSSDPMNKWVGKWTEYKYKSEGIVPVLDKSGASVIWTFESDGTWNTSEYDNGYCIVHATEYDMKQFDNRKGSGRDREQRGLWTLQNDTLRLL